MNHEHHRKLRRARSVRRRRDATRATGRGSIHEPVGFAVVRGSIRLGRASEHTSSMRNWSAVRLCCSVPLCDPVSSAFVANQASRIAS